jgi:hypothetical protein
MCFTLLLDIELSSKFLMKFDFHNAIICRNLRFVDYMLGYILFGPLIWRFSKTSQRENTICQTMHKLNLLELLVRVCDQFRTKDLKKDRQLPLRQMMVYESRRWDAETCPNFLFLQSWFIQTEALGAALLPLPDELMVEIIIFLGDLCDCLWLFLLCFLLIII